MKNSAIGPRIRTFKELFVAAGASRCVIIPSWLPQHHKAAKWIACMPALLVQRFLNDGMYIYIPKRER